jgi:Domain of unknown function (DUF4352)
MNHSKLTAIVAATMTVGLLTACGGGEGGGLNETPLPTSAVPAATQISPEQLALQSAASSGYSLKALAIEDPAQPAAGYKADPDTRLVSVQIELGNVSADDKMAIDVSNATVTDDKGVDYNAVAGARDGEIKTGDLGKGEKSSGWISFAVPKDANLQSITYRVGLISTIALTANLPKK